MQCEYEAALSTFGAGTRNVNVCSVLDSLRRAVIFGMCQDNIETNPGLRYFTNTQPKNTSTEELIQRVKKSGYFQSIGYKKLVPLFKSNHDTWDVCLNAPTVRGQYVWRNGHIELSITLTSNEVEGSIYRETVIPSFLTIRDEFFKNWDRKASPIHSYQDHGVQRIPTVHVFNDGKIVAHVLGNLELWRYLNTNELLRLFSLLSFTGQKLKIVESRMIASAPQNVAPSY